ncbi:MAG: pyrroloquinoline quinone precursor peptide PqqA [Gemmatimonadetes bacterium]|nr:MAG: pyrroloquinoline quinone precursor peptide PqqA [Gemmatimonadota bacterium]
MISPGGNILMTWTKPEFEVVELGMEVGAYAGNA